MTIKQRARARDVEEAVNGMPAGHIFCRDYGHTWQPNTVHKLKGGAYDQVLRCPRCDTYRHRVLDRDGSVVTNQYRYESDYLIAGLGRLTGSDRGVLRLASVTASLPEGER